MIFFRGEMCEEFSKYFTKSTPEEKLMSYGNPVSDRTLKTIQKFVQVNAIYAVRDKL